MSNTSKIVVVLVVLALVIGGWWYYGKEKAVAPSEDITGNSDASLDQDIAKVDAEMNALNADSASIDAGLNDTPVPQE